LGPAIGHRGGRGLIASGGYSKLTLLLRLDPNSKLHPSAIIGQHRLVAVAIGTPGCRGNTPKPIARRPTHACDGVIKHNL
jgi:hypothetical protein